MTDRRQVLAVAAGTAALALLPLRVLAQTAAATPTPTPATTPAADAAAAAATPAAGAAAPAKTTEELIADFTGGADVADGGVTLTAPEIAENGNTVPVTVESEGAGEILLIATGNPAPEVGIFRFGELAGKSLAATRIRLAKTQDVVAIAKLADGSFGRATANIKVTIGGCGG